MLLGLTDFAYWLYVTDLGVDRDYERQGIGCRLMKQAHELAGGEKDIAVYLIANENAIPFCEKLGMKKADDVMKYNHIEWTVFRAGVRRLSSVWMDQPSKFPAGFSVLLRFMPDDCAGVDEAVRGPDSN